MIKSVYIAMSLDGYIAGANGDLSWLDSVPNPNNEDFGYSKFINEIDALIMGRNTYETVVNFDLDWPYEKPVYVLSKSEIEISRNLQDRACVSQKTPKDILKELAGKGMKKVYIDGGAVIQSFLAENQIDELTIFIFPILLGKGTRLFGNLKSEIRLELKSTDVFLNQIIRSHYIVLR